MNMQVNSVYTGFMLKEETFIKEINATGRLFEHHRSGARLVSLACEDDNKVFSIGFRTPPEDNTGIPHILEHSVLCGSRKFPSKEPFVELVKGSLNTFLNAMTFSDKTLYPVASKNEKDFYNLMDVYLDAVFYPRIYQDPDIFMQEGWHYEMDSPESDIRYRGVVYSEMQGVFSTPEALLFRKIPQSLLPDTPYGYESGGDPEAIPELTYQKFISYHKKYYHPSNSYIFLYGNGDLFQQLEFIHENYLKDFSRIEVNSTISRQEPFASPVEMSLEYPISPHEPDQDRTFLSLNFADGDCTDPELNLALSIMEFFLLETPSAPLREELMRAEIGKDVFGQFEGDILQPIFSVVLKNSSLEQRRKFQHIVFETCSRLTEQGIDKEIIEAGINIYEFKLREADFRGLPKGLVYCLQLMTSWLYDRDPFLHLRYEGPLGNIKSAAASDYFERLLSRYILHNSHSSLVMVKPAKGLGEKKYKQIREKLSGLKGRMTPRQVAEIVDKTKKLRQRQAAPDPEELLEKIPLLSLKDIKKEAERLPLDEDREQEVKVLSHIMPTNKIAYLNMMFDTTVVPQEDLPWLSLLARVLGKVSTQHYSYAQLSNLVNIHTGGVSFGTAPFGEKDNAHIYYPKMTVSAKALIQKLPRMGELVSEIIARTRFDEKKRLKEVIQETKSRMEMGIYQSGHLIASGRLLSYFSPVSCFAENINGLSFYRFIADLEKNFDGDLEKIISGLHRVKNLIFNRKNMMVSITIPGENYNQFKECLLKVVDNLQDNEAKNHEYNFNLSPLNEGLMTPANVQFVAQGYNFKKLGYPYRGALMVLRTIASMDYLWNNIRVQGGAYGCFARFTRNGNAYFCSYRDPHLRQTLDVYKNADRYFSTFDVSDREMTKYIIGTISRLDRPLTPSMKGEVAAERYIRGYSMEDIQEDRDEVLSTTKKDIREAAGVVRDSMVQNCHCVLGNEGKIRENKDLFNNLVSVFE